MKTLIVHLPGGDKIFTSDEFQFGTPDKTGGIEVMKLDGTAHVAFSNVSTEVQTSDPEPVVEAQTEGDIGVDTPESPTIAA